MKARHSVFLCAAAVAAAAFLCGCHLGSAQYSARIRSQPVETADLNRADFYKGYLPNRLGVDTNQIRIEAGSGVTQVFVSGVSNDYLRSTLMGTAADINAQHPFGPIQIILE